MKLNKSVLVGMFATVMLMANSGFALAEDDADMGDMQFCKQEAEQSGMSNEQEVQEYVSQCLDELQMQKEIEAEPEIGLKEEDGEKW